MDLQQPQLFGFLGFFMVWTVTSSIQTFSFSCTHSKQHVQPTNGDMLADGLYPDHIVLTNYGKIGTWVNCSSWDAMSKFVYPCHKLTSIACQAMNITHIFSQQNQQQTCKTKSAVMQGPASEDHGECSGHERMRPHPTSEHAWTAYLECKDT